MNNGDALIAVQEYYDTKNPTPDDEFKFTEALGYLIEETKDPKYMCELGWFYCSKKRFDLEIKYLEMAAEYGYLPANGANINWLICTDSDAQSKRTRISTVR